MPPPPYRIASRRPRRGSFSRASYLGCACPASRWVDVRRSRAFPGTSGARRSRGRTYNMIVASDSYFGSWFLFFTAALRNGQSPNVARTAPVRPLGPLSTRSPTAARRAENRFSHPTLNSTPTCTNLPAGWPCWSRPARASITNGLTFSPPAHVLYARG